MSNTIIQPTYSSSPTHNKTTYPYTHPYLSIHLPNAILASGYLSTYAYLRLWLPTHLCIWYLPLLPTYSPIHTAARPTAHSFTLPPTYPFTRPPTYPYSYLTPYWFLVISPPMHTYVSGYPPTFAYLPIYEIRTHQPTHTAARPTTHSSTLAPTYPFTHRPAAFPPTYPYTYLTPYWSLVISLTICQAVSLSLCSPG